MDSRRILAQQKATSSKLVGKGVSFLAIAAPQFMSWHRRGGGATTSAQLKSDPFGRDRPLIDRSTPVIGWKG